MTIIPFKPRQLYEPTLFAANTEFGRFTASGTLCGHIDFAGPFRGTYPLSPDEALAIITMLTQALADVLDHADPLHDPRIISSRAR